MKEPFQLGNFSIGLRDNAGLKTLNGVTSHGL